MHKISLAPDRLKNGTGYGQGESGADEISDPGGTRPAFPESTKKVLRTPGPVDRESLRTRGPQCWRFVDGQRKFEIRLAMDGASKKRAQGLVKQAYGARGLHLETAVAKPFNSHREEEKFALIVETDHGKLAGTVGLVVESANGLPCDSIFRAEADALRKKGRRLAEVTGLAADRAESKEVLLHLMDFVLILARRVVRATDVLIEVHPRHTLFYRRALLFEEAGSVRACRRVGGAPASLLRLDLDLMREALLKEGGRCGNGTRPERSQTYYAHFYSLEKEKDVAAFLANSVNSSRPTDPALESERESGSRRPPPGGIKYDR